MMVGVLWPGPVWLPQLLAHSSSLTADASGWQTFEVYRNILSAQVRENASELTGWHFIL